MILLLDLGNSRIKWALAENGIFLAQGIGESVASLDWSAIPAPERVRGCSVASQTLNHEIELAVLAHWGLAVQWLVPATQPCGLRSQYDLTLLGADRWAAALGARARMPGQALVVVSAGTAMVVDALSAQGDYLGGMILPGYRLMKTALADATAKLPLTEGEFRPFPQTTGDAIETGCLTALAGAITAMTLRLAAIGQHEVQIVLSGGDASRIAPCLAQTGMIIDNVVLHGLAVLDAWGAPQ